jgi:hypothetical protein
MATEIVNNGATLKLTIGTVSKLILKTQIKEISVVNTNVIKLDTGQGLYNNFITYADVTNPVTANPEALRDAINAMLTTGGGGSATETKQDAEITELQNIKTRMDTLLGKVDTLNDRVFIEALLVDEATPNTIYKGYAIPGASTANPVWAIEKTTCLGDVTIKKWASGNKNFDKVWNNRAVLIYS